MLFRGETFGTRALRNPAIRGCKACLAEDLAQAPECPLSVMALRGDWQLREATTCTRHQQPLVELWRETAPLRRYDAGARLTEILPMLGAATTTAPMQPVTAYDRWLERRLNDGTDATWLKGVSLYSATTLCDLLGRALAGSASLRGEATQTEHAAALSAGFDVLAAGRVSFRSTLDQLARAASGPTDEPAKAFGPLYGKLARDYLQDPDFDVFRAVLRESILDHWPYAVGETLLGQPVEARRLHSVASAAQEANIYPPTLDAIITATGGFAVDDTRPLGRKVFPPEKHAALIDKILTWVGPGKMRDAIGASKKAFENLVADGVLRPKHDAPRVLTRWSLADGHDFLRELDEIAMDVPREEPGWEPLMQAKKRRRLALAVVVDAVRSGSLRLGRAEGTAGFDGFRVRTREVDALTVPKKYDAIAPTFDEGSASAAEFGRKVGMRGGGQFVALVAAGVIEAQKAAHPSTGRRQHRLGPEEMAAFHRKFLTSATAATEFGLHQKTVLARIKAAGVATLQLNGQSAGQIWLRSDIEHLLR